MGFNMVRKLCLDVKVNKSSCSDQVSCAVGSREVTLDVGVEDLHSRLDEAAPGEVLILLDQCQPGLQQLIICLHVHHVILIQLEKKKNGYDFNHVT